MMVAEPRSTAIRIPSGVERTTPDATDPFMGRLANSNLPAADCVSTCIHSFPTITAPSPCASGSILATDAIFAEKLYPVRLGSLTGQRLSSPVSDMVT